MVTLAGVSQSFRHGCSLLEGLAGWSACHEVVRQVCYRQAGEMAQQREAAPPEAEAFRQASGQMEFQTDATALNTLLGWREMKIGVFVKRRAGSPATAEQWDRRDLPGPEARVAFAAVSEIEAFAPWCVVVGGAAGPGPAEAERLRRRRGLDLGPRRDAVRLLV